MSATHEVVRPIGGDNAPPPGALVDASAWVTRRELEAQGIIRPLAPRAPIAIPDHKVGKRA